MLVWHIREKCYKYDVSNNEMIKKNKKVEFFNAFSVYMNLWPII